MAWYSVCSIPIGLSISLEQANSSSLPPDERDVPSSNGGCHWSRHRADSDLRWKTLSLRRNGGNQRSRAEIRRAHCDHGWSRDRCTQCASNRFSDWCARDSREERCVHDPTGRSKDGGIVYRTSFCRSSCGSKKSARDHPICKVRGSPNSHGSRLPVMKCVLYLNGSKRTA